MPPVNDTYRVQRTINAAGPAGTAVTVNDVGPTADRWNLAALEIKVP